MVNLQDPSLSEVFHALRDPVRRDLLARLSLGEAAIATLAAAHAISLPAISRHVRILEEAGLVRRRKRGREFLLSLRPGALHEAASWMHALNASEARAPDSRRLPTRLGDRYRPALSRRRLN